MNRKQKVAVVVGALVIALLVLFPPWRAGFEGAGLRWIGSPKYVTREVPVMETHYVDTGEREKFDPFRGLGDSGEERPTESVQVGVENRRVYVFRDVTMLAALLAIALVLTVAAVVVLKDGKPNRA